MKAFNKLNVISLATSVSLLLSISYSCIRYDNTEIFQYKTNTFIKNWLLCGPFPNCKNCSPTDFFHGENCRGFYTDYLESTGGEMLAIPEAGMAIDFPGLDTNPEWFFLDDPPFRKRKGFHCLL